MMNFQDFFYIKCSRIDSKLQNRFLDSSILRFLDPDSGIEGIEESKKNSPRNRFLVLWNRNSPTYKLHQGPQKKYADLYTFLYSQIKEMRAEKMVVTHELLISLAINELEEISMLSYNGKRSLIDRFMKFNNLSLRTITSTSSSNADQITEEDRQTIDSFRREYNNIILSNNIPQECVFNMDQCGVAYEIPPKKTIDHVGSQQSSITTRG